MKECDSSKVYISSNFLLSVCLLIQLDTLLLRPLQHFATLHHTSPNYTALHLSTLQFLSFTLHYPLIWLNPFTSTLHVDVISFMIPRSILLTVKNVSDQSCTGNQNTRFICNPYPPRKIVPFTRRRKMW
jgi:hypothetical protein